MIVTKGLGAGQLVLKGYAISRVSSVVDNVLRWFGVVRKQGRPYLGGTGTRPQLSARKLER